MTFDSRPLPGAIAPNAAIPRYQALADEVLARCALLARHTATPPALSRAFLTAEHRAANQAVTEWMVSAGMTVREDALGTVIGRYPASSSDAPVVIIGSHLDSVPNAGRFDGPLGVLLGIAAVAHLRAIDQPLPFHVEVVGFGDEEGVRFGATLLSSRAMAGAWSDDWLALTDANGLTLAEALRDFGLEPERVSTDCPLTSPIRAYLEVHIEQGPVLEQRGLPVGVVTAIAGTRRLLVTVTGQAGHAGTVPMDLRRDALVGAALGVALLEATALEHGVTATTGRLTCLPGGVNVIPGEVTFSIDIRAGVDSRRDAALAAFEAGFAELCAARGLDCTWTTIHQADAAACCPELQALLSDAIREQGIEPLHLVSGAGHDAMAMAAACPVGMLFVRCAGGISHHPDESVAPCDVAVALAVLVAAVQRLAETDTSPMPGVLSGPKA